MHVLCEFDPDKKSYKVYYEGNQPGVTDNVTFERVDDVEKADIVWQMKTFRDFKFESTSYFLFSLWLVNNTSTYLLKIAA